MALRLETRYGPMWMHIGRQHTKEHANLEFEKEFIEVIETEEYEYFVDIGAGWGYFSIPASHYCTFVKAYEPFDTRFNLLVENVTNLNINNIVLSQLPIGTGKLKLFVGGNMVGPKSGVRKNPVLEINWRTLETVLEGLYVPGIVKIDVEGAELDVIESAGDLEQYRNITWLIERHQRKGYGYSEEELFKKMTPFKGELVGSRAWTYHYIFRR